MKKISLALLLLLCCFVQLQANNVQLSNIALTGQNTVSDFTMVNFGISWENSWRTNTNESNYDGAWVFVKFRKKNSSNWQHATMNYVSPGSAAACGHTQPAGSIIKTPADGKGIWIYRAGFGQGNNNFTGGQLRWNYGVDGVLDNDSVEVRVFAVEMVYVPQGGYYLGSGGSESYHFRDGAVDTYYPINSENAITCGNAAGNLWTASNGAYWFTGTLPAAFPKGYNAVWIMKYEFSQQQYIDFLNNIDYNKFVTNNSYSGAYTIGSHPNLSAANPAQTMGYISINNVLAWLDWAALRPFTELEFEKACRGSNQVPIANEYAWGNTTISEVSGAINGGTATETWVSGNCNYTNSVGSGIRCGALATGSSTRTSSGATYYGIMEMSGNMYEWCVSGGDAVGRAFTGAHGDGNLTASGNHNTANWPSPSGAADGLAIRGGAAASSTAQCGISDRIYGSYPYPSSNSYNLGGRGARTGE